VVGYGFEGEELYNTKYWLIKNRYKMPKVFTTFEISKGVFVCNQYLETGLKPLSTLLKFQKSLPQLR
jgi:hypothetical protein